MLLRVNDFGSFLTLESCQKISVNDLVRQTKAKVKRQYLESVTLESGLKIDLTTSRTRFGGQRYWFCCPGCGRRVGVLYQGGGGVGCRRCLGLRYRKSRYRGMVGY